MNHAETPTDDTEVLRLLRESNSLGSDSALFLRPLRQLLAEGKPVGKVFALTTAVDETRRFPFAAITATRSKRLIFWPAMPRNANMKIGVPEGPPDHISVDFPSERPHVTAYGANGKPSHHCNLWRSGELGRGLRLLFGYFVQLDVLRDQDVLISRNVPIPPTDNARRTAALENYAKTFEVLPVLHELSPNGADYFYCGVLAATVELTADNKPESLFPTKGIETLVDGWPSDSVFQMNCLPLPPFSALGQVHLYLTVAYAPGKLKDPVAFAFPQRK